MDLSSHEDAGKRRGQRILLGLVAFCVAATLFIFAPLWFPSAQPQTYFFTVPKNFTGPIVAIYPVPGGAVAKQGNRDNQLYYQLNPERPIVLGENAPEGGAQSAVANLSGSELLPLLFYSSSYGGNDLYFVDGHKVSQFGVKKPDGSIVTLSEVRFHVYDRRDPSSLEAMLSEGGTGERLSAEAREEAASKLGGSLASLP